MHSDFNLYWSSRTDNRKDMQVLMAVRKDILNNVIIENRIDLVCHPYYTVLNIRERNSVSRKYSKRIRVVVNLYDSKIGSGCVWQGSGSTIQRAIQNIC